MAVIELRVILREFTQLADELRVSVNTVKSVWYRYCEEMQTLAKPTGGSTSAKLQEEDLELIEVLKVHSPAMSLFRNHRGVRAVWWTTNFNVGRFAGHKKQTAFGSAIFKEKTHKSGK